MELTQTYFEQLLAQALDFLPRLLFGIVIFLIGLYLANLTAKIVLRTLKMRHIDPELTLLLVRVSRWTVIIFGLVLGLQQVNFNLSSFVAGLGIVGFTIGFAFQDIAKNFIAGVLLLIQQPFDIGDAIEVSGYGGTVIDIEIRSTTLKTWDGKYVIIPNADVYTTSITNFSRSPHRRVQVEVGVAYDTDLPHATDILLRAATAIEGVLVDPAPQVVFTTFADSSINCTVYFWIDTATIGLFPAQDQAVKNIKLALEHAGIEIPYPVQTVLMGK